MFTEKPGKPDPPEITKITPRSATLSWKPPKDDGGSPITNYVVQFRIEGGFKWNTANESEKVSDTKFIVPALKEGTVYEFRIAAENRAGVGPASDPTAPIEAKEQVCEYSFFFTICI